MTTIHSAGTLPDAVHARMPKVDWQSWEELGEQLPALWRFRL